MKPERWDLLHEGPQGISAMLWVPLHGLMVHRVTHVVGDLRVECGKGRMCAEFEIGADLRPHPSQMPRLAFVGGLEQMLALYLRRLGAEGEVHYVDADKVKCSGGRIPITATRIEYDLDVQKAKLLPELASARANGTVKCGSVTIEVTNLHIALKKADA